MLLSLVLLLAVPVAGAAADGKDGKDAADVSSSIDAPRAVGVTDTHATLVALVVPGDEGGTAGFEYGPTTAYGSTAAGLPAQIPETGATVSASIADLAPATTYHFRIVLDGTVAGPDSTFTTAATPPAPDEGGDAPAGDNEPAPVQAPVAPVLGRSVAVAARNGTVRVRRPDASRSVPLVAGATVPTGSVLDATAGTVALTSALDARGTVQTGEFTGGRFVVRQSGRDGTIDVYLRGSLGGCRAGIARLASTAGERRGRRLWARDHGGRFRTHGGNSVATARGTRWFTEDTCAGTRTRVIEGAVSVRDLRRKRTVTVRAGRSYLARRAP